MKKDGRTQFLFSGMLRAYGVPLGVLASLVGLVSIRADSSYLFDADISSGMDHWTYLSMAEDPFGTHGTAYEPPLGWRVLAPLIVSLAPLEASTGFRVLTVCAHAGTTLALIWFLLGLGLPPRSASAGGIVFVLLGPAVGFTLLDYMYIDPLAFFLLTLTLASAVHRRGWLVCVSLPLLALTKETVLLDLLFTMTWTVLARDKRLLKWVAAGSGLSVLMFVVIRSAIVPAYPYSVIEEFKSVYVPFSLTNVVRRLMEATGGAWNVLLPVASMQLVHGPRVWRNPACVVLVALSSSRLRACGTLL